MHDSSTIALENLRVDPAQWSRRPKGWKRHYVHMPWLWVERLQATKRISTYRLAFLVLYESWKSGGRPVVLTNILAAEVGLTRRAKWRSLLELERMGLVKVERREKKSPLVMPI